MSLYLNSLFKATRRQPCEGVRLHGLKHMYLRLLDSVLFAYVRLEGYISFQAVGLSRGDVVPADFRLVFVVSLVGRSDTIASRGAEPIRLLSAFDYIASLFSFNSREWD